MGAEFLSSMILRRDISYSSELFLPKLVSSHTSDLFGHASPFHKTLKEVTTNVTSARRGYGNTFHLQRGYINQKFMLT